MEQTTIGLLYPGYSAEDDYPALENRLNKRVRLPVVHTTVDEDAHHVDALLDLGSPSRLALGGKALLPYSPDAVMWACTSGSFVFGWDGARDQAQQLAELMGRPASSTSIAFVDAVRELGLSRIAVAASYPADIAGRFVDFLGHGGVEVTNIESHDIITAAEVGRLSRDDVVALVASVPSAGAEALLVPDTAMHSLAWIDALEEAAGMPVLTANQVTVWKGLQLLGTPPTLDGLGTLFHKGRK